VDSTGAVQLSQPGVGILTVPNTQSDNDISIAKLNDDGTTTTTTMAASGNSIATTETDVDGSVVLTSITDLSSGTNQSTTSFTDADGNSLGSLQTTSTVGANSTTTVSAQLDANGLLLGTTSTVTNNDGSSDFTSKDSQGNTLSEQVTAPDGSAVSTTYNSLSDPNLISTISTDANGNVSETSSTVAGDTPDSYVSTTLGAYGILIELETQTTDASGINDYQVHYENGALSSASNIAADGSRTETQYEDPADPNITQSSNFDENGDLVSQSSTQMIESNGAYLTTTTNPSGETLSTALEQMDGSTTRTIFNDPSDTNLKTVIEDNAEGDLVSVSTTTVGTDSDYLTVRQNGDGETTGTDKTNITYDDQGQQIEHTQSYDSNGVPTGTNDEVTSPDGHVSATIDGTGVYADLNNAAITLTGTNDAITGSGDVISASNAVLAISNSLGGADDVITGDNNTIATDSSAITLNGAGEVVSGSYDTLSLGAASSATLDSFGDVITLGAGVNLTTDGGGADTINASADDTLVIATDTNDSYNTDTLNVTGDQNITLDSGAAVNVMGSGNAITVGDGVSLTEITGSGNAIAASNDNLSLSNNGGEDNVITGDNNTIAVNDSGAITLNGAGEIVSDNVGTLSLGAGSSATVEGYLDTITVGADVNLTLDGFGGNTIDASTDDTFVIGAADGDADGYSQDTLNVTDSQNITLENDVSVDVEGSGNAITTEDSVGLTASNDTINVQGTYDSIIGSGDAVAANNDNLWILNSVGGADDVVTGDNNTIQANSSAITLNGVGEVVFGGYGAVSLAAGSSATLDSYGEDINLGAGVDLTLDGYGGNTIDASADDTFVIGAADDVADTGGYSKDTLNVTGDQNITLDSGVSVSVVGNGNAITTEDSVSLTASNDTINVQGTYDWITGSGDAIAASGDFLWISNSHGVASDVVTGDNNTIGASDSAITVNGSDETLFGNNEAITVADGRGITVSGRGDTIAASSDQITLSGDNSSLVIQGNEDNFAVTGTNDRIIDDRADGTSVLYAWNGTGGETETVYSGANDSGDIIGGYGYSGTGAGADLPGSYGDGGDGGGYGFAGPQSLVSSSVGANIGSIAQYDLNHGYLSAAASAEAAQQQAASIATLAPTSGTGS
ncbi:MAG: hypothetical protein P4N59_13025, partial [Negativicutes bacterium]|nr:hypothetical protein [Negativicutes bacterium]